MIHRTRTAETSPGNGPGNDPGNLEQTAGEIDYRLARHATINDYRKGRVGRNEICDAQPELRRAAAHASRPTLETCPICEEGMLVLVSYVFGPRLPAHGRCVTTAKELAQIREQSGDFTCFVIEVCPSCWWNHLQRTTSA